MPWRPIAVRLLGRGRVEFLLQAGEPDPGGVELGLLGYLLLVGQPLLGSRAFGPRVFCLSGGPFEEGGNVGQLVAWGSTTTSRWSTCPRRST